MDFRDVDDLKLGVNLDVSLSNRNCVGHDRKMDENSDVNLCLRMSDLLDDPNSGVMMDASHDHRMNVTDDLNLDVSRVNRNCVRRDLKMDVNLDVMSHRVKLTGDRSTSCDRMSRDHLQCDHQMMRHRDTNRMDVKNLDAMKMMNHRVNRRMMDDLKMVCLMKI